MKHRAQHPRAATVLLHPHRADRGLVKQNRHRQFGHGAGRAQRLVWPEEMTNDYLELKSLGGSLSEASLSAVWTLAAGTGESQKQKSLTAGLANPACDSTSSVFITGDTWMVQEPI
uniref:Uncharacterized protein n=1 Tax=Knipowitschia caucasica TaxID=637954 RepID=A0AAV2JPT5_KNICA